MSNTSPLDLRSVLAQIRQDRNIDKAILTEALEMAVVSAAQRKLGMEVDLEARYNEETGEVEVYEFKRIVAGESSREGEISLQDARKLDPELTESAVGEDLGVKLESAEFGRIAAQNARQVIVHRLREAERAVIYKEYANRKGELIAGTVRRIDRGNIVVDLGRTEAIVPPSEQVHNEVVRVGDRVMAYVLDVLEASRGSQIILSRAHANLVVKLFEQEVPEIAEGIVAVEGVAREAGFRTKIAVRSRDADVDPVGTCVGMKGVRVQAVVQELRGEKIDIVPFSQDEVRFACNALAPAEITRVLVDEGRRCMQVVVPDDQQSLAIGRGGQNVRLGSELIGWKIDISSETKVAQEQEVAFQSLGRIEGLNQLSLQALYNHGIRNAADVIEAQDAFLQQLPGFDDQNIADLKEKARQVVGLETQRQEERLRQARGRARLLFVLDRLTDALAQKADTSLDVLRQPEFLSQDREQLYQGGYHDLIDIYLGGTSDRLIALGLAETRAREVRELVCRQLHERTQEPAFLPPSAPQGGLLAKTSRNVQPEGAKEGTAATNPSAESDAPG